MRRPLVAAWASALVACSSSPSPETPKAGVDVGQASQTDTTSSSSTPPSSDPRRPASAKPKLPGDKADAYGAWLERGVMATDKMMTAAAEAFAKEPATLVLPTTDTFDGELCPSAKLVPPSVPTAWAEVSDRSGFDDATWKCLRFSEPTAIAAQYSYLVGSGFKSPPRGGAELGANAFEACVEADLEPGGETTLLCRTGVVDPENGTLKTSTEPFLAEEFAPDPGRKLPPAKRPAPPTERTSDGGCIPVMALLLCRAASSEPCTEELSAAGQSEPGATACVAKCARKDDLCVVKCFPRCG